MRPPALTSGPAAPATSHLSCFAGRVWTSPVEVPGLCDYRLGAALVCAKQLQIKIVYIDAEYRLVVFIFFALQKYLLLRQFFWQSNNYYVSKILSISSSGALPRARHFF